MYLIQMLLPLFDNNKQPFSKTTYDDVRNELTEQFGGVTLYRHSPAEGLWNDETGKTNYDELITAEVMCTELDRAWWQRYKDGLKEIFKQDEIVIRFTQCELL